MIDTNPKAQQRDTISMSRFSESTASTANPHSMQFGRQQTPVWGMHQQMALLPQNNFAFNNPMAMGLMPQTLLRSAGNGVGIPVAPWSANTMPCQPWGAMAMGSRIGSNTPGGISQFGGQGRSTQGNLAQLLYAMSELLGSFGELTGALSGGGLPHQPMFMPVNGTLPWAGGMNNFAGGAAMSTPYGQGFMAGLLAAPLLLNLGQQMLNGLQSGGILGAYQQATGLNPNSGLSMLGMPLWNLPGVPQGSMPNPQQPYNPNLQYGTTGMPPGSGPMPMDKDQAMRVIYNNWDKVAPENKMTLETLKSASQDPSASAELQTAAKWLVDNPTVFADMDIANWRNHQERRGAGIHVFGDLGAKIHKTNKRDGIVGIEDMASIITRTGNGLGDKQIVETLKKNFDAISEDGVFGRQHLESIANGRMPNGGDPPRDLKAAAEALLQPDKAYLLDRLDFSYHKSEGRRKDGRDQLIGMKDLNTYLKDAARGDSQTSDMGRYLNTAPTNASGTVVDPGFRTAPPNTVPYFNGALNPMGYMNPLAYQPGGYNFASLATQALLQNLMLQRQAIMS